MRLICGPNNFDVAGATGAQRVTLYGQPTAAGRGSAGEAAGDEIMRRHLEPTTRAWDLLSIALSVVTADGAGLRRQSADGWTREFELDIAVADPDFWNTQALPLAEMLAFLTTDRWQMRFHGGGFAPRPPDSAIHPSEDCVALLSGGLDSLAGVIDQSARGRKVLAVSQTVRGDAAKQAEFASKIGGGLTHLPLSHNARTPNAEETSQRARSLIFITYGVLAATALKRYQGGESVPLFVCENGFIAINPPLTGARLGSLSTRTAHPGFLGRLQRVIDAADLRVKVENPYGASTKGEMLRGCSDQQLLMANAKQSTSCGRFQRFGYRQCGRCVPCQVRRAAFLGWGVTDTTPYVYVPLGKNDDDHARFDDVRSMAMALAVVKTDGLDAWLGSALSSPMIANRAALRDMIRRGLDELAALHLSLGVR